MQLKANVSRVELADGRFCYIKDLLLGDLEKAERFQQEHPKDNYGYAARLLQPSICDEDGELVYKSEEECKQLPVKFMIELTDRIVELNGMGEKKV